MTAVIDRCRQLECTEETKIFIPNEIFDDLQQHQQLKQIPSHLGFAYSYYYLVNYLYRYCKYPGYPVWTQQRIKAFLGYAKNNKRLDYIIKEHGVLDSLEYTENTPDWPLAVDWGVGFTEFFTLEQYLSGFQKFDAVSEQRQLMTKGIPFNFRIKYPIKAFYREVEIDGCVHDEGTFNFVGRTHGIQVRAFAEAMQNPYVGTTGFYIYSFIKHKNDWHGAGYTRSYEKLARDLGIPERTVTKYLRELHEFGFVSTQQSPYLIGAPREEHEANTYSANPASEIVRERVPRPRRIVLRYEEEPEVG